MILIYNNRELIMKESLMMLLLVGACSLSIDSNDVMNGDGLFLNQSISGFTLAITHSSSFLTVNGSNVLKIEKPSNEAVSFSSGLSYPFSASTPSHVSFQFASTNPDTEDSNFRLMDTNTGNTLVLFRAGKGGLIRVNEKQMISFYNDSVSTDSNVLLTKVDLKINWTTKQIEIFVGDTYKDKCAFFNDAITSVNQLLIYNLYQSVSYWSNIVICSSICYSFNHQNYLVLGLVSILLLQLLHI